MKKRMLFWHQLRKMAAIHPGTDDLWRDERPKLLFSLTWRGFLTTLPAAILVSHERKPELGTLSIHGFKL